jgi:hypothetical protein
MIAPAFKRCVAGTSRPLLTRNGLRRFVRAFLLAATAASLGLATDAVAEGAVPRASEHYLQYGLAFASEMVAAAGGICPTNALNPCILGSGVGLALRAGYRTRGPFYVGGAYEFSRQDSSNLLRLAILQQVRGEARYYLLEESRLTPYLAAAVGGVLYGNEWGADTGGLSAYLGVGAELQVSRTTVVGAALGYRSVVLRRWEDSAGQLRADDLFGFGVGHIIGLELVFEVRDPLPRW